MIYNIWPMKFSLCTIFFFIFSYIHVSALPMQMTSLTNVEVTATGTSADNTEALKTAHSTENQVDEQCPICLDEFQKDQDVR